MREKNGRKEHISFSQVQENLFAGQRSGGKAKQGKRKQHISSRKTTHKKHFQKTHTQDI